VHGAYRLSTRLFAVVVCGLGIAMIVTTLIRGGGPFALGVIAGAGFVMMGAARFYLASQQ
jgi:hypothetical protein